MSNNTHDTSELDLSDAIELQTGDLQTKHIKSRILHVLETFPQVSPSMLQITIGSGIPAEIWKPILEEMIEHEDLYRTFKQVTTPGGRVQMITIISRNQIEVDTPITG